MTTDSDTGADPKSSGLPPGVERVRTTPVFTEETTPKGLLSAHRIAGGVWARLVVLSGSLVCRFEDERVARPLGVGESLVLPPKRYHHLELNGPVEYQVEFYQ